MHALQPSSARPPPYACQARVSTAVRPFYGVAHLFERGKACLRDLSDKQVTLQTSDDEQFKVDRDVANRSVLIRNMLEDVGESEQAIPLPNVSANVLKKVLEWCEHHKKDPEPLAEDLDDNRRKTTEISDWDAKFIQVDQEMLFEIILAANYLDIKPLLDVGCKTVANMIKGKQPEEIRKLFNIVNDFTPEEEAQIKKENEWAEDR